ncbi:MAG TPA: TIGR03619 family F420-dependent LLM class oxidoreductase [Ilumatobacter sp.]|nr:TIGR03619 family F420-dependent LLM class oxidoreductase [Ilumatobacter sp.]
MKIGLTAYDVHPTEFVELGRAADAAGFSSLWLGEHVLVPLGYETEHPTTQQPGVQHHTGPIVRPDTELVDPLVQFAAVAAVTTGIELATGIFVLPLRHPLAVARSICTLQDLSAGRFLLGLGFGWLREEFDALDVPFGERVSRFEEGVEVLRLACAGGEIRHSGRHFDIAGVQVCNRPTPVPLMLGGNVERALQRAAVLGDGWFASGTPPFDEAVRLRTEVLSRRAATDRADEPFRVTVRITGVDPEVVDTYAEAGFDEVLLWADQIWPSNEPLEVQRATVFEHAAALGLEPRT